MEYALLASLAEEDRRRVLSQATRRKFARNEVVFHEGDPAHSLHFLAKGRVAFRIVTPFGETATLDIVGPGVAFGELALLEPDGIRSATVVALEPVETLALHRTEFEKMSRDHPDTYRLLAIALAQRVRELSRLLEEALYVPADRRVIRRLLDLVDVYRDDDGERTVIPVSQEALATLAGTTRPTANRVLRAAAEAGAVALSRGRVEILDRELLARRAR